ncbi:hypothetical protein LOTGIDRAFT_147728, partial [Lottia gigantea]
LPWTTLQYQYKTGYFCLTKDKPGYLTIYFSFEARQELKLTGTKYLNEQLSPSFTCY